MDTEYMRVKQLTAQRQQTLSRVPTLTPSSIGHSANLSRLSVKSGTWNAVVAVNDIQFSSAHHVLVLRLK